jgi:hypothetical protein
MSILKDESIELLLELEEKLTELLHTTSRDDHARYNRLAHLIVRTRVIRQGWGTRWQRLEGALLAHDLAERAGRRNVP